MERVQGNLFFWNATIEATNQWVVHEFQIMFQRLTFVWVLFVTNKLLNDFIIRTTLSKPLVMISILDYVFVDLLHIATYSLALISVTTSLKTLKVPIPHVVAVPLSWLLFMSILMVFLYLTFGVIIRYVFITTKRIYLGSITDERLRWLTLGTGIVIAIIICLCLNLWGEPAYFRSQTGGINLSKHKAFSYVMSALASFSIVLNITLSFLIRKKNSEADGA
eukprot:TCALIF_09572-PA protein Name:"Protein of unknown function" AED:0.09 eAED:0.09 QI:139/1/0.5/1/1/0.5/2/0/220